MPHVQSAPAPLHMAADSTMQYGDMVKQSGHFHPEQARHGQLGQRDLARLSPRPRRKKIMPEQLDVLINVFALSTTLSFEDREQLARRLGMTNREVQVWFQNRRAKVSRERQQEDQSPAWLQESPSSDSSPDSPPHESRHMVDHAVKPFGSSRPSMQGIERSRSDQRPYMRACPASDDRIIIRSPPSTGSTPGTHAAFTPSSAYATSASSQSGTPHSMDIKRDSYFPSLTRTTSEARAEGYFSGTVPRLPDPRSNFLGLRTKSAPNAVTLPPPWAAGGPSRPAGPRPHEPDGVARRAEGRDGINLLADIAIDTLAREKRRA
ncbi:uncharacterized protein L969DRAFT_51771 [Mixia osmundae IAM 14324]|uniref:Homeobox domain-containing protein n=1 Tax=Mixia osmundae (strain CBS 9802 / IAM 14324 / JCM 22182 / KY 12970) TaxID=764103 RepID=G7DWN9_MIXOS|nr:uncharacterized protein L969DRAFT_51771 [Mixia osmundae IAM 14324]KEI38043.1 hypothetical protein L969DRAFT_51771 [Mixia osmundae IAM 14324]GAA95151.1 hypothetical protein E5Q_01806 [Mixia osmundae IAM 14324]